MRDLFPGYFAPTKQEFEELWREATFAFDANVLLDLYRLTAESRQVFFEVLNRLGDRIFLPHQAAREYLRHRLEAISARSRSHEEIKNDAVKFVRTLETRIQEHPLPKSEEILRAARKAEKKINEIVDAALKKEPDLLRSDGLLDKLASLFEGKTGPPYDSSQFDDVCKKAAGRYTRKIPPGYKDDNKGEPAKFGDAIIWFQLLDLASSAKRPLIFITRDVKEDWWLLHNGETIGPRPELAQEMKQIASVRFHMYTTPRFLEFAQQTFDLKPEPTRRATSEIKEIEKQDKEAAASFADTWTTGEVSAAWPAWVSAPTGYATGVVQQNPSVTFSTVSPEQEAAKNEYLQLLPINGQVFNSSTGNWGCEVASVPSPGPTDRLCYQLKFEPIDRIRGPKHLTLWVSHAGLHHDLDWEYKKAIFRMISAWLDTGRTSGQVEYFG